MKFEIPKRVWINSPAKETPYYSYHTKVGIAHTRGDGETIVYFSEGPFISMPVKPQYLVLTELQLEELEPEFNKC